MKVYMIAYGVQTELPEGQTVITRPAIIVLDDSRSTNVRSGDIVNVGTGFVTTTWLSPDSTIDPDAIN
jgi:hypothetical protein